MQLLQRRFIELFKHGLVVRQDLHVTFTSASSLSFSGYLPQVSILTLTQKETWKLLCQLYEFEKPLVA